MQWSANTHHTSYEELHRHDTFAFQLFTSRPCAAFGFIPSTMMTSSIATWMPCVEELSSKIESHFHPCTTTCILDHRHPPLVFTLAAMRLQIPLRNPYPNTTFPISFASDRFSQCFRLSILSTSSYYPVDLLLYHADLDHIISYYQTAKIERPKNHQKHLQILIAAHYVWFHLVFSGHWDTIHRSSLTLG